MNAHATSTQAGDLAEVNAIKQVFKDTSELKMNGTKVRNLFNSKYFRTPNNILLILKLINIVSSFFQSMIGHGIGAAGALEAITTIKAITTGWLHPTINQDVLP